MATLAEAVDATEIDWIVSANITADYLTVEDETVAVLAHFSSGLDPQTRAAVASRIRVQRGVGGTTAASHADGTTLTPLIPPAAASVGGGGVTVDNQSDPPAEVTTLIAPGWTLDGDEATVPEGGGGGGLVLSETEPEDADTGTIWLKPSTLRYRQKAVVDWEPDLTLFVEATEAGEQALTGARSAATGDNAAITDLYSNTVDGNALTDVESIASGGGQAEFTVKASQSGTNNSQMTIRSESSGTAGDAYGDIRTGVVAPNTTGSAYMDIFATSPGNGGDSYLSLKAVRSSASAEIQLVAAASGGAQVFIRNLPTADPVNAEQLWNDAGTLKVSAG
jgi:hypothetical protein